MKKFFAIEPQRDANRGLDRDDTEYVSCSPDEAEIWGLFESDGPDPEHALETDWELVDDFESRDAAYAAAMALGYKPEQEEL